MKNVLMIAVLVSIAASANLYVSVNPGDYSIVYTAVGGDPVLENSSSGPYLLEISDGGRIRFSQRAGAPVQDMFYDGESGGGAYAIQGDIETYVPYYSEKQILTLSYNGETVASYNFTDLCNRDSVCGGREDYISCPSDCGKLELDAYTAADIIENKTPVPAGPYYIDDYQPKPVWDTIIDELEWHGIRDWQICCGSLLLLIGIGSGYVVAKKL